MELIINEKVFKQYDKDYYVSEDGDVFSLYSKKILKHYIDLDGYHRVDIHSKHMKVHKLVYLVWVGNIHKGEQVNHIDDNKDNNNYTNLYVGSQKENIHDCMNNGHRQGNIWYLTVYDKEKDSMISFCPASQFIQYCGHPCHNQSVKRMFNKNWFKKRYEIIDYRKKSVTTIADECKLVG